MRACTSLIVKLTATAQAVRIPWQRMPRKDGAGVQVVLFLFEECACLAGGSAHKRNKACCGKESSKGQLQALCGCLHAYVGENKS